MSLKYIISETINNYIDNIIKEYHDQPRLPFEEFGYGHAYMDEFIDWVQYASQKGELPRPTITWEEGIIKGIKEYSKKIHRDEGILYDEVKEHGLFEIPQFDENGNLYVERVLSIDVNNVDTPSPELYNKLIQSYEDNVGGCWSWKSDAAQAYCGAYDGGVTIKLCGYMYLNDIYWGELVRKATNHYKHEYEVRTYPRGRIMLTKIIFSDYNNTYTMEVNHFDGPRVLRQTYFGNNSSFQGDYAKIGLQGIGYDKEYIDRQGNEYTRDELRTKGIEFFDKIYPYQDGLARVYNENKGYNFINEKGELISNQWFDSAFSFKENFCVVINNKLGYNYINKKGEILSKTWFFNADSFRDGYGKVENRYSDENLIDENGELVWKGDKWFSEMHKIRRTPIPLFTVYDYEHPGYNIINEKGELLWKGEKWFDNIGRYGDGFIRIQIKDLGYNYIDLNGNLLWKSNIWFDEVNKFGLDGEGYGLVTLDNKHYWIDTKGQLEDYETLEPIDLEKLGLG